MNLSTPATAAAARSTSSLGTALLVAVVGIGMIIMAGFVQADTLHSAAHDVRHATGFPCH